MLDFDKYKKEKAETTINISSPMYKLQCVTYNHTFCCCFNQYLIYAQKLSDIKYPCPHLYACLFFSYNHSLYCSGYAGTVTSSSFARVLLALGLPCFSEAGTLITPTQNLVSTNLHPIIIELYKALNNLIQFTSSEHELTLSQLVQVYKIKNQLSTSVFDQPEKNLRFKDDYIVIESNGSYHYLCSDTISLFNEKYNEKLDLSPLCTKIVQRLLPSNKAAAPTETQLQKSFQHCLFYPNISSVNPIWYNQYGSFTIGNPCKPKHMFYNLSVSIYPRTALSEQVVKFLYVLTGGSIKLLEELAKLTSNIYLTHKAQEHLTIVHASSPHLFLKFLSFVTQISTYDLYDISIPLKDFTEAYFITTVAHMTKIPFSISLDYSLTLKGKEKFLKQLINHDHIQLKDPLIGKIGFECFTHFIHLTDSESDIATLQKAFPTTIIRLPHASESDMPPFVSIFQPWLAQIFPLYGVKLLAQSASMEKGITKDEMTQLMINDFTAKFCAVDAKSTCKASDLYVAYKTYICERGYSPMIKKHFCDFIMKEYNMKESDYDRNHIAKNDNVKHYMGLRFDREGFENRTLPQLADASDALSYEAFSNHLHEIDEQITFM